MKIFSDGGARGNPGPGACAFIVLEGDMVLHQGTKYLGNSTNNQAEYQGVLLALDWAMEKLTQRNTNEIDFYVDSELIAKQINGLYKVKDPVLKKLNDDVQKKLKGISAKVIFRNIPRTQNKLADYLVNKTLDSFLMK